MYQRCLIISLVLLLAGWAVAKDPPALTEGITSVGAGDYTRAVLLLQPLAGDRPNDSVLNYWLGRAYYGQRQFHAAVKYLAVAANWNSDDHDTCLWYARALRGAGKAKEAVEAYAAVVDRFPADITALAEYAAVQAMAGDYSGARATFAHVLAANPTPETRAAVAAWNRSLDGLTTRSQLEPACSLRAGQFQLCYDANDPAYRMVRDELLRAEERTRKLTGIPLQNFRVLLFPTWAAFSRYARILLPEGSELHSAAFSLPGLLVLWSPNDWAPRKTLQQEFTDIIRHEMIHLAFYQHTGGDGIPTWLNEGLACYFGGWGGLQAGQIAEKPLDLNNLDRCFLKGDLDTQEQAYAQAHAMVTVLAHKLDTPGLVKFVDKLVDGTPISLAYEQLSGEKFDTFLAVWPMRFAGK